VQHLLAANSLRDYRSLVLELRPVGYWPLDGSGSAVVGPSGTLGGGPGPAVARPLVPGRGRGLLFDGDDDRVDLGTIEPDDPLSLAASPFTICAWIHVSTAAMDNYARVIDRSDGGQGANGWNLILQADGSVPDTDGIARIEINVNTTRFNSNAAVYTRGQTHFVAGRVTADTYAIFVDAVDVGGTYLSGAHQLPPATTTGCRIGTWNHSTAREFRGTMQHVAVFNRGLAADEIVALYKGGLHGRSQ